MKSIVRRNTGKSYEAMLLSADQGDTSTVAITLLDAQAKPGVVRAADEPGTVHSFNLVANKDYHNRKF